MCRASATSATSAAATGTNASHLIPQSREDLAIRHRCLRRLAVNGKIALRKVAETGTGIVVRGALATLAPFADEIFVYPGQPIPRDADDYALAFSIPQLASRMAEAIGDDSAVTETLLGETWSSGELDGEQRALVRAAVGYFVLSDDVNNDLVAADGFEDDVAVVNAVAAAVGLADVRVATN